METNKKKIIRIENSVIINDTTESKEKVEKIDPLMIRSHWINKFNKVQVSTSTDIISDATIISDAIISKNLQSNSKDVKNYPIVAGNCDIDVQLKGKFMLFLLPPFFLLKFIVEYEQLFGANNC